MIEYERKFLIDLEKFKSSDAQILDMIHIKQGYVCSDNNSVVRLRQTMQSKFDSITWFITIKQNMPEAGKHHEFEYQISDASELFDTIQKRIIKTRHVIAIPNTHLLIELDEFLGNHKGLWLAEVELKSEDDSNLLTANLPDWFVQEVTGDNRYSNYHLSNNQ